MVYKEGAVPFLFLSPLLFLRMLMLFLNDSDFKLKRLCLWTRKPCSTDVLAFICLTFAGYLLWAVALTLRSFGGTWRAGDWWYQLCPCVVFGVHLCRLRSCLWWVSRDAQEESHFLPEFWTSNFPSGTQNDPVTHEQRYFFGKLVSISSLHTSQHSIFPTCQVKYAVVYPDFLFLSGTKLVGACTQGFVNRGITW